MSPRRSFRVKVFAAAALASVASVATAGCGKREIDKQQARRVAVDLLGAYENKDPVTICKLSSRAEREGFETAGVQFDPKLTGCVDVAREAFKDLTPLDAAFRGLKPGKVTDVRRG